MTARALAAAAAVASCIWAAPASARVETPAKGAIAIGVDDAQVFGDAMTFKAATMSSATAEAIIKDEIAEAHAAGVRMFWFDATSSTSAATIWRANRWNAAARAFNTANPNAKVCIIPGFRTADAGDGSTTGALPLFDAIDAGASESPLCEKGGKPVVATTGAACTNPLTVLSARGPFVVFASYEADPWVPPSACVTALKGAGASLVYAAVTVATSTPAFSTASMITTTQNAATAAGADGYILGIGNARSSACGIGGNGTFTGNVSMIDMNYWQMLLSGGREAITRNLDYIIYSSGFSGNIQRGSYVTAARVCDPRDRAIHNVDSGGINRGFSCPNVPDDFKAAIPASYDRSLSLPYWTRPGMVEAAKVWNAWISSGTEPSTATPWVGFAYRQHGYGLAGTWQICPDATYTIGSSSFGGVYQGDHIALTSWAATPIKVRVKLAGETLFDGILPAKQMALSDVAQAQTKVAIGGRVGRPIIEILNEAGAVVSSKEGLLAITNTPKHWGGKTGRNLGLYADFVPFASDIGSRGISLGTTGKITSNLVHDIAGIGIETRGMADDVDTVGNTVSGAKIGIGLGSTAGAGRGRSMATVNNIVVGSTALGIGASGEVATDAIYANNLLNGNAQDMQPGIAAVAAGTITGAPAFVSSTDFHLQSSSPARGAGLAAYSTGTDRDGRARKVPQDIGAYDFFDPAARTPCEDAGAPPIDPCDPGGVDYPCNTEPPVVDTCIAAPTLTSPTNISVGAAGGTYTLGRDEDAMVTCQDLVVTKTITIIGGNKVHVRGCEVVLGWDVAAALNREALKLVGMREAYVEGSIFDANDRCDAVTVALKGSGIAYDNSATKLTLVNTWTGNNNYNQLDGACAGNCLDVQGDGQTGQLDVYADRLTCVSKGEGIFVPDRQPTGDNIVNLKRTNVRFGPNGVPKFNVFRDGALLHLYFSGWEGMNENIQVRLDQVYSDWTQSNRNIGPGPATGDDALVDFTDANLIKFKGANFTGVINKGVPTTGDFAPRAKLGRAYNRFESCSDGSPSTDDDPGDIGGDPGGEGTTPPPSGTYDLALEFDNRTAGTTYTNAMQVEDSGGRSVENYTGGIYTSPITIVDNGEGGKALRVGVGPNCQQASHRPTGLTPGKEYIFETRLRFAPNFISAQNDGGGKVFFGIQGGVNNTYNPSENDTSGSTLVMYAGKSRLRDYTYDQTRSCVGSSQCWGKVYHDFGSKATGWHTIKIRTKLNTPGQSNGILEYWYDGVKTLSKTNMLWIKSGIDWSWYKARLTTTIGGPCNVGGTNSFSEASYVDYDYFRYQRVN